MMNWKFWFQIWFVGFVVNALFALSIASKWQNAAFSIVLFSGVFVAITTVLKLGERRNGKSKD